MSDSPRKRSIFDDRIAKSEFSFETGEAENGSGMAMLKFYGVVYDEEWGEDFERKLNDVCRRGRWTLAPIIVDPYAECIVVSIIFGAPQLSDTLQQLARLLKALKLKASDARTVGESDR